MKTNLKSTASTLAAALLWLPLAQWGQAASAGAINPPGQRRPHLQPADAAKLNTSPRGFIPNVGQVPNDVVKFSLRDHGVSAYFTDQGFVLWNGQATTVTRDGIAMPVPVAPRWELVGARPVEPVAGKTFKHTVSFFRGNDPAKWHANVPAYRDLRYPEILKGVEMSVESRERGFEYSFHVKPHAKPELRFRYDGITALEKSPLGDLIVRTAKGHFTESRPESYQWIEGTKREIESSFELVSANEYRIAVGPYDEHHELVIDPVLDWSTFLGRTYNDEIRPVKVDADGNICVTGRTFSTDLPITPGVFGPDPGVNYDSNLNQWFADVFVAKLNASGTELLWLGYLGGAGASVDEPGYHGLAVDIAGNLYIGGYTGSADFPVTADAFQGHLAGGWDAFVTKIQANGSTILWSSLLGGEDLELGLGLALDPQENVFLTGFTRSSDFPTVSAFDSTLDRAQDAFVVKFDSSGAIRWSSYLGGAGDADRGAAVVADTAGNVFVFGDTDSSGFATLGAFDTTLGGNNDAFLAKIQSDGTAVMWTTYLGGSVLENVEDTWFSPIQFGKGDVALDSTGNILVAGETTSVDFPATAGAFQTTRAGDADGYVAKLTPDGASLVWASYLGGSSEGQFQDRVWGIAVNPWDEVFVVGRTDSSNFPVTPGALQTSFQGGLQDGFLTKLSADGSTLLYSTYLGGSEGRDGALGLVYDSGNVFVAAFAVSASFPSTAGAYQTACYSCSLNGNDDSVILKFLDAYIAHDGFESGNYEGGSGWTSGWTKSGDVSILTSSGPHSGTRHVRLRKNTGKLQRTASVVGAATVQLGFWAKVNSFEGNDKAYVKVSSNGASWTTLFTFNPTFSDNQYHYYEFDVPGFLPASQLQVEFDAEMNSANDNWYLDDIRLVGTQ